jgi:transcriptional regulator with XRE-family HTH domain
MRQPRVIPRSLFTRPAFTQALALRDFAAVFSAAHAAGLTYSEIGDAISVKPTRISLIARGGQTVTGIDTIERIADGLQIPGAMLGLADREWERQEDRQQEEVEPVRRRQVLQRMIAAGTIGGLADVLASTQEALAYTGAVDVADVEAAAERNSLGYRNRTPEAMLDELVAEIAGAAPLLTLHHPASVRADLARAIGQLGAMTAIVLHDMGRHADASQWFATAVTAARTSGDRQTLSWVQARRAMVPLNYGAPRTAARIAQQACEAAGKQESAAAALAASVAARAYALSHQSDQARESLATADRIAARLSAAESADTWLAYSQHKHHVHRSQALTSLMSTSAARESQQAGLELAGTTGMTRPLLLLDQAMCVFRDGDPSEACEAALEVIERAPERFRTGLVRQRALELYEAVPSGARQSSAGRDLAAALAGHPGCTNHRRVVRSGP